jgi:hypothetical protein
MVKFRKLVAHGCTRQQACVANSRYGPWWCAGTPQLRQALSPSYFQEQKLFSILEDVLKREQHQQRNRPAMAGTRMSGGVRAGGRESPGYSIISKRQVLSGRSL